MRDYKLPQGILSLFTAKDYRGKTTRNGIDVNYNTGNGEWRLATVNNAVVKYRQYAEQLGISKPHSNLRIIALNSSDGTGSAPMLRRTWGLYGFTVESDLITFFLKANRRSLTINAIKTILQFTLPDILIDAKYSSSNNTAAVYETTFHELGHASHFKIVGSEYWVKYSNYIITYGTFSGNPYGDGTGHNVGHCALAEAWGHHIGRFLTIQEFGNNNSFFSKNSFENFDPLDRPDEYSVAVYSGKTGWTGWIPAGIMYDIIDTNSDFIRSGYYDKVSGYSTNDLFNALDSNIDTPQKFRDRLLQENGNLDRTDLLDIFKAYYWN